MKEVGSAVENLSEGEIVVVKPVLRYGRCEHYLLGRYNLCEKLEVSGVTTDSGFAERIVPQKYLRRLMLRKLFW